MDRSFVLEKLRIKKSLDPDCIGFGVERHRYELQPPIEESKLESLEARYGISLPGSYRRFLLTIGNGGAGPGYGLYSLEGALCGTPDKAYGYPGSEAGEEIRKPFIRPDQILKEDEHDDQGMLTLCQHGCAHDDFLVLNSAERGFVWTYIEWAGHHVPLLKRMPSFLQLNDVPIKDRPQAERKLINTLLSATNDRKMNFSDWYGDWLEKPPYILPNARKQTRNDNRRFTVRKDGTLDYT
jgi:hypothetical protein